MSSAQHKAAFCDGVWLFGTEGCMAWSQKQLFPLQAKTVCLTKGRGFKIPHLWQGFLWFMEGKWKSVSKIKLNFHFFPLSSEQMCCSVFRDVDERGGSIQGFTTGLANTNISYLSLEFWSHKDKLLASPWIWRALFTLFLAGGEGWKCSLQMLPLSKVDKQGRAVLHAVVRVMWRWLLVNSCSPLLSCEWFAVCHTAYFNELHLYVV